MAWNVPNPIKQSTFVIREGEDEYDLKMQFAKIVARDPSKAMLAGYELFPGTENYGRAMQAQAWLSDPVVVAQINHIVGNDVTSLLPTEDDVKLATWNVAQEAKDLKVKLSALELLSKQMGILKGNSEGGGGGNVLIQNVIKLPNRVQGDQEEELFSARFEAQQLKLVRDARSPRKD